MVENDSNSLGGILHIREPIHIDTYVLAEGTRFEITIHRCEGHSDPMSSLLNALVEEISSLKNRLKKAGIE